MQVLPWMGLSATHTFHMAGENRIKIFLMTYSNFTRTQLCTAQLTVHFIHFLEENSKLKFDSRSGNVSVSHSVKSINTDVTERKGNFRTHRRSVIVSCHVNS